MQAAYAKKDRRAREPQKPLPLARKRWVFTVVAVILCSGAALGMVLRGHFSSPRDHAADAGSEPRPATLRSYVDLLALAPAALDELDVALTNLLCAESLPGSAGLDVSAILAKLDAWAKQVRSETERHLYRATDPRYADHYGHSESRLRAEFLVQVLQEDCGVRYNEQRIRNVDFSDSKDLFIHGLLDPANGGTCASMPVLYAAVGRRLGYPISLVLAKHHIFCRWDDGKEWFNIEGTANGGVDFFADEHYRAWPARISDAEMARGEYLVSLSPAEELSVFLVNRAACLHANGRLGEARAALTQAQRLMPKASAPAMALRALDSNGIRGPMLRRPVQRAVPTPGPPAGGFWSSGPGGASGSSSADSVAGGRPGSSTIGY